MIRAVIFDLWGTLVRSEGGDPFLHLKTFLDASQTARFQELKRDAQSQKHADARCFLERWRDPLGLSPEQLQAMAEIFPAAARQATCFPETLDALDRTRQVARLGLLSNTQSFDMGFLKTLGLEERISNRFLSAETRARKPESAAFETVQRKLSLFPGELAMVGDSWNDDVQGALDAGWTAIWINRNGLPRPEIDPEADLVEVDSLAPVPDIIERLQAGSRCSTCLG